MKWILKHPFEFLFSVLNRLNAFIKAYFSLIFFNSVHHFWLDLIRCFAGLPDQTDFARAVSHNNFASTGESTTMLAFLKKFSGVFGNISNKRHSCGHLKWWIFKSHANRVYHSKNICFFFLHHKNWVKAEVVCITILERISELQGSFKAFSWIYHFRMSKSIPEVRFRSFSIPTIVHK